MPRLFVIYRRPLLIIFLRYDINHRTIYICIISNPFWTIFILHHRPSPVYRLYITTIFGFHNFKYCKIYFETYWALLADVCAQRTEYYYFSTDVGVSSIYLFPTCHTSWFRWTATDLYYKSGPININRYIMVFFIIIIIIMVRISLCTKKTSK